MHRIYISIDYFLDTLWSYFETVYVSMDSTVFQLFQSIDTLFNCSLITCYIYLRRHCVNFIFCSAIWPHRNVHNAQFVINCIQCASSCYEWAARCKIISSLIDITLVRCAHCLCSLCDRPGPAVDSQESARNIVAQFIRKSRLHRYCCMYYCKQ